MSLHEVVNQAVLGIRRDDCMKAARSCRVRGEMGFCRSFMDAARIYNQCLIRARKAERREREQADAFSNAFVRYHEQRTKMHWTELNTAGHTSPDDPS